jgi:SIR2-like domain
MENVLTKATYDFEDRRAIVESVTATFKRMDNLFIEKMFHAIDKEINYATLRVFMSKFAENSMFTLNQDTILERLLQNWTIAFDMPYVHQFDVAKISDQRPASPPQAASQKIRIVKLHGSHTWLNSQGVPVMVLGINKSQTIAGSWLLTEYQNMFEAALGSGGVRLMVIGYSFGDKHINKIIATAVSRHQCKIFVWNPCHPLDMLQEQKQEQKALRNGLMGWEPRRIADVMPAAGAGPRIADNEIFPEFFT